jgi:hypothetical protein
MQVFIPLAMSISSFLVSVSLETQLIVVTTFHFHSCCYILSSIKVEVESRVFQGRGEGNFRNYILFSRRK